MSTPVQPTAEVLPRYKGPGKLRQKREEPRGSRERLAKIVGKHPSCIELDAPAGQRSQADLMTKSGNCARSGKAQQQIICNLEEQSSCGEAL